MYSILMTFVYLWASSALCESHFESIQGQRQADTNRNYQLALPNTGYYATEMLQGSNHYRIRQSPPNQHIQGSNPYQPSIFPDNKESEQIRFYQNEQLQNYQMALQQILDEEADAASNRIGVHNPAPRSVQYDDDHPKDCSAPRESGSFCATAIQKQMFYYDTAQKVCQPFMFNGCGGNGNRFETADECRRFCVDGVMTNHLERDDPNKLQASMKVACQAEYATDHLTPLQCVVEGCPAGYQCRSGFCCPTPEFLCSLRYDSGRFAIGAEKSPRYFYTSEYKTCMRFSFYGTLGNANNFPDFNSCMRTCSSQH